MISGRPLRLAPPPDKDTIVRVGTVISLHHSYVQVHRFRCPRFDDWYEGMASPSPSVVAIINNHNIYCTRLLTICIRIVASPCMRCWKSSLFTLYSYTVPENHGKKWSPDQYQHINDLDCRQMKLHGTMDVIFDTAIDFVCCRKYEYLHLIMMEQSLYSTQWSIVRTPCSALDNRLRLANRHLCS